MIFLDDDRTYGIVAAAAAMEQGSRGVHFLVRGSELHVRTDGKSPTAPPRRSMFTCESIVLYYNYIVVQFLIRL